MTNTTSSKPLWAPTPETARQTLTRRFMEHVEADFNVTVNDWAALYDFSVQRPEDFWVALKDFSNVSAESWGDVVLENGNRMPGAKWFPGAKLNFAENLLRRRDDKDAIVFWGEDQQKRRLSANELYNEVSRFAAALKALGVKPGERVAGAMPNMAEAVIAMLATSTIGAVWASCSPDFGTQGMLDRFGQIEPKVFVVPDGYYYGGKRHDCLQKAAQVLKQLPSVTQMVVVSYAGSDEPMPDGATGWDDFLEPFVAGELSFYRAPFDHPLFIMFSSGTTGVPKCIVHGAGGTLLQHLKEHKLHSDIRPDDRVFYFTTCGWMMWNWLVSALASEAVLLLYDGSPLYPDGNILFDFADAENATFMGTSAKFIDAAKKAGLTPMKTHDLKNLRTMASTGSPLAAEAFDWVYANVKKDVHLASISGGTDIISCFVLGNPLGKVWRGEIQSAGLAMAVDVFTEAGRPAEVGEKGELVCKAPFPSMPVGFWNDPDGARYRAAYFEKFPHIWTHGDWMAKTDHGNEGGGFIIYGRSDATLNPGGVRIGTAEIYRQVEKLDAIQEAIAVGQDWQGDVRVILFVVLAEGVVLDDVLTQTVRHAIREGCTPRHVPARVLAVGDIPRTRSGKITELAVRDVIHGRAVKNIEALANPEALEHFKDRPELSV